MPQCLGCQALPGGWGASGVTTFLLTSLPTCLLPSLGAGFNRRVSPTSFYPMMSGVATEARAASMMSGWLLNSSRFCVAPSGDFKGNSAISSLLQPRLQPYVSRLQP